MDASTCEDGTYCIVYLLHSTLWTYFLHYFLHYQLDAIWLKQQLKWFVAAVLRPSAFFSAIATNKLPAACDQVAYCL